MNQKRCCNNYVQSSAIHTLSTQKRQKIVIGWLVVMCCSLLLPCCRNKNSCAAFVRPVKTECVQVEAPSSYEVVSGTVEAKTDINVVFRVPGSIAHLAVQPGDYVHEGDLLATIDDREYLAAYQAAASKYDQIREEVNRVKTLYERNSVAKNDYEKAMAGLQSSKSMFETAKYQLENTQLYAPIDGYIQNVAVNLHQMVTPLTNIVTIVDTRKLSISANLSSSLYLKRDEFDSYSAKSPLLPDSLPLTLQYITPKANNSQLFKMSLLLNEQSKQQLAPGMIVSVKINYKATNKDIITIPITSIFGESNKSYVWLLDTAAMRVHQCEIQLGELTPSQRMEVTAGLSPHDIIVTAGKDYLKEDQSVKLENRATAGNPTNQL